MKMMKIGSRLLDKKIKNKKERKEKKILDLDSSGCTYTVLEHLDALHLRQWRILSEILEGTTSC